MKDWKDLLLKGLIVWNIALVTPIAMYGTIQIGRQGIKIVRSIVESIYQKENQLNQIILKSQREHYEKASPQEKDILDILDNNNKLSLLEKQAQKYISESLDKKLAGNTSQKEIDLAKKCYQEIIKMLPERSGLGRRQKDYYRENIEFLTKHLN